jgi:RNA polymerase sporulation-specific sigma factor
MLYQLPIVSAKKRKELLGKTLQGDKQAREDFIQANLRLVARIAHRFKNSKIDFDDLFQIGCVGLIKAVDRFDLSFGFAFSTYAVSIISGEIKHKLRYSRVINIPRGIYDTRTKIQRLRRAYEEKYSRQPTVTYIAQELNLSRFEIFESLNAFKELFSTERVRRNSKTQEEFEQMLPCPNSTEDNWINALVVEQLLRVLTDRERRVIELYFLKEYKQQEIGAVMGISQAHICRIIKTALNKLKAVKRNYEP